MVVQTGPVVSKLDRTTLRTVMFKLNKFVRSARFEQVLLDWINASNEAKIFAKMEYVE